jgi:hypothetical protein
VLITPSAWGSQLLGYNHHHQLHASHQYVVRISKKSNHKTLLYVRINEMALAAKMNIQFKDLYGPGSNREIEEQGKFLKCIQEIVVSPKFYQNTRHSENAIKECPLLL